MFTTSPTERYSSRRMSAATPCTWSGSAFWARLPAPAIKLGSANGSSDFQYPLYFSSQTNAFISSDPGPVQYSRTSMCLMTVAISQVGSGNEWTGSIASYCTAVGTGLLRQVKTCLFLGIIYNMTALRSETDRQFQSSGMTLIQLYPLLCWTYGAWSTVRHAFPIPYSLTPSWFTYFSSI